MYVYMQIMPELRSCWQICAMLKWICNQGYIIITVMQLQNLPRYIHAEKL